MDINQDVVSHQIGGAALAQKLTVDINRQVQFICLLQSPTQVR